MLGERLQELRKDHGLSQQDLADKLNVSIHTISSYERNRSAPDDKTKMEIAKLFDISLDYLLDVYKRQEINTSGSSNRKAPPNDKERELSLFVLCLSVFKSVCFWYFLLGVRQIEWAFGSPFLIAYKNVSCRGVFPWQETFLFILLFKCINPLLKSPPLHPPDAAGICDFSQASAVNASLYICASKYRLYAPLPFAGHRSGMVHYPHPPVQNSRW